MAGTNTFKLMPGIGVYGGVRTSPEGVYKQGICVTGVGENYTDPIGDVFNLCYYLKGLRRSAREVGGVVVKG